MASTLPAKLKAAGIQPFATRAAQLEKYRPIVWYWCEYHILQQILSKQLHLGDDECQAYAIQLMDKLETFKVANSANDAITDDVAAKAYIENFATETFARADEAQRTNKVTRQTADTFQAAATFIDLLSIWAQLDGEMAATSRYAKYHAVRIAKAIKAGEDPNATHSVVEEPAAASEDNVDAELETLKQQQQNGTAPASIYHPSTVEDVPASALPLRPESAKPPDAEGREHYRSPLVATLGETSHETGPVPSDTVAVHDVSPIEPTDFSHTRRLSSVGGDYFPSYVEAPDSDSLVSDSERQDNPPVMYSQPTTQQQSDDPLEICSSHYDAIPTPRPTSVKSPFPERPGQPPPEHMNPQLPAAPLVRTLSSYYASRPPQVSRAQAMPSAFAPPPLGQAGSPAGGYRTDDESLLAAQKHAKWAISALNFEDVNTAVKELRIALQSLDAT